MTGTYPVEWWPLFTSLTSSLSVTLVVSVFAIMAGRFVSVGFDPAKTFQHVSLPVSLLLLLGMPVLSAVIAFLVAMIMRLAKVTITDKTIQGVNYWGLKRRIPLGEVTGLDSFSNNGIHATVVHSHRHGQIYISDKTHRLPELLQFLNTTIAENEEREKAAAAPLD
ncbi:MAG TPA: hypothetical protein VGE39_16035 [Prosthecobacter sp.]